MTEAQFQIVRGLAFGAAIVVAIVLQRLAPYAARRGSVRANVGLWAVNVVVGGGLCGACALTAAAWAAAAGFGLLHVLAAPAWLAIVVTVLVLDLVSYAWHRANHVVPALWAFHRVHHSDVSFTVTTALRFHPGEVLLSLPLRLGAVAVLGAPAIGVVAFEILFTIANLIDHGDIRLPARVERRVDGIVITPALHRYHHTRAGAERDHNFGTIFALWDGLLGTYRASASSARVDVGVPEIERRLGLWETLALPARSWSRARE